MWWHGAAIYQVYPRSFRDSNGDGEGDLRGVIAGLDYLRELGVDAIWLSPFYPSPMVDSGYDVADPRGVDPRFGTLDDARAMIEAAHSRGLRVIVDVVPNHVSREHVWFGEALASAPASAARERFHFRDGRGVDGSEPPTNWVSVFSGPAWTRITEPDGTPGQWYLHLFDSSQPDLNWSNAEVLADSLETLRFWLDMGVDGFRVDVAWGLAKDMSYPDHPDPVGLCEGIRLDLYDGSDEAKTRRALIAGSPVWDRDEVHDIYRQWRKVLDSYDDRMTVAEAWVYPPERAQAYVRGDTLHQLFNFDLLAAPWDATTMRRVIDETLTALAPVHAPATWALSNHDTARVVTRLGSLDRARAVAMVVHALPGSVYVYQGEELGLADAAIPDGRRQDPVWFRSGGAQAGRDGARAPLPWSGDAPPYGFGGDGWLPQPDDWAAFTIEAESADPSSTLSLYRAMLRMRHDNPALAAEVPLRWRVSADGVLAFDRGEHFTCIANTGAAIELRVDGRVVLASRPVVTIADGLLQIPSDTTVWVIR